jgi:hypothetical protein
VTVVAAVVARLEDVGAVTSLVSDRIQATHLDEDSAMPAVLVQLIGRVKGQHLRGPDNIADFRVQVDSVASTKSAADQLAAAVEGDGLGTLASGLMGWKGHIGSPPVYIDSVKPAGEREHYDPPPTRQYRVQLDYIVSFRGF